MVERSIVMHRILRLNGLKEITQSVGITLNEAKVTSSNPPPLLLCGHVKKE
jgi:hypothetical protein